MTWLGYQVRVRSGKLLAFRGIGRSAGDPYHREAPTSRPGDQSPDASGEAVAVLRPLVRVHRADPDGPPRVGPEREPVAGHATRRSRRPSQSGSVVSLIHHGYFQDLA